MLYKQIDKQANRHTAKGIDKQLGRQVLHDLLKRVIRDRLLLLMLVPGLAYFILFRYLPMGGLLVAFMEYDIFKGMLGSSWVGLEHFRSAFASEEFWRVLSNTLLISLYKIGFGFPIPIVLAVLLNEIRIVMFRRTVQTLLYLPHFISWVVIGGIMLTLLSPNYGIVTDIAALFLSSRTFGKAPGGEPSSTWLP
jgi:putative aldouronate transport system permease protein